MYWPHFVPTPWVYELVWLLQHQQSHAEVCASPRHTCLLDWMAHPTVHPAWKQTGLIWQQIRTGCTIFWANRFRMSASFISTKCPEIGEGCLLVYKCIKAYTDTIELPVCMIRMAVAHTTADCRCSKKKKMQEIVHVMKWRFSCCCGIIPHVYLTIFYY